MRRTPRMRIEQRDPATLTSYAGNPRRIPDAAVEAVAASIRQYGFRQPIVVDAAGVVIVGHTRLLAALKLELPTVPVHVADLTPAQARAYRLADNKTGKLPAGIAEARGGIARDGGNAPSGMRTP